MPHAMVVDMKTYGGYGITEMRTMAREYKIVGRSKMTGDQLLIALRAFWDAQRQIEERRVSAEVGSGSWIGVELVMPCGCIIRATSEVQTSEKHGGALYVSGEYVSLCVNDMAGWTSEARRIAYVNHNARGENGGDPYRFMLYSLFANNKIKAV